jgi:hypothetical protein
MPRNRVAAWGSEVWPEDRAGAHSFSVGANHIADGQAPLHRLLTGGSSAAVATTTSRRRAPAGVAL